MWHVADNLPSLSFKCLVYRIRIFKLEQCVLKLPDCNNKLRRPTLRKQIPKLQYYILGRKVGMGCYWFKNFFKPVHLYYLELKSHTGSLVSFTTYFEIWRSMLNFILRKHTQKSSWHLFPTSFFLQCDSSLLTAWKSSTATSTFNLL